jgi:sugar lactone lactonase YvrE
MSNLFSGGHAPVSTRPSRFYRIGVFLSIVIASMTIVPSTFAQANDDSIWSIVAGTGKATGPVANQPSTPTTVVTRNVYGIEVTDDAIYLTTVDDHSIWKMAPRFKQLVRVGGTGEAGRSGDEGPAARATFRAPHEIRADEEGNLFVADTRNHSIRRIDGTSGIVTTFAGNGRAGFAGDGQSGDRVQFNQPHSLVLDGAGGVLVADTKNHRLRRIDLASGKVTTIAGDGRPRLPEEGEVADRVSLHGPRSLAIDDESIWLVLREGNSVWRIDRKSNRIYRVAGTGEQGHSGDGGNPLKATFRGPKGIAVDSKGNLLIVDTENHALRYVDLGRNHIRTLGTGFTMKRPHGTAVLTKANGTDVFLISDSENHRVLASPAR